MDMVYEEGDEILEAHVNNHGFREQGTRKASLERSLVSWDYEGIAFLLSKVTVSLETLALRMMTVKT